MGQSYQKKLPIANPRPVSRISSRRSSSTGAVRASRRKASVAWTKREMTGRVTQRNTKIGDETTPKHLQSKLNQHVCTCFTSCPARGGCRCARPRRPGEEPTPTIGLTPAIVSVSVGLRVLGVESGVVVGVLRRCRCGGNDLMFDSLSRSSVSSQSPGSSHYITSASLPAQCAW